MSVMAMLRQPSNRALEYGVGYNAPVWQKFHILSRSQVFAVASASAVVIALAVALASIPADGTSWNRFLGPSRQFDPFINFGSAFVSILPGVSWLLPFGPARIVGGRRRCSGDVLCDSSLRWFRFRVPIDWSFSGVARSYIRGFLATA